MKSKALLATATVTFICTIVVLGQGQAPAPGAPAVAAAPLQQGPGIQAPNDARYREWVNSKCKNPPAPRGGGAGRGGAAAPAVRPMHRDYTVTEIPGVIAAGQKWTTIWTGTGNNADGILADGGGILAAQNTDSKVMKIDKKNKVSFPYKDTNTGGAVSLSKKGVLFVNERGLPNSIWQLKPKRKLHADTFNGEPLDCLGGVLNDLSADSKGGVYFTMGGLYYADPKGVVTKQGTVAGTNGIVLSADEKTLYVTGRIGVAAAPAAGGGRGAAAAPAAPGTGGSIIAYDVRPDASLTNERQFATAGGDGTTIDSMGRVYSTGGLGIQVLSPEGKFLGEIPAPLNLITAAFSGPDKKTLYGVANNQQFDEIFTIPMISQGYKGRAK